jgi:hypothetical protein
MPANAVVSASLGVVVLRLEAGQVLSLWDELLPIEARELPEDLARIDVLLGDPGLLAPVRAARTGRPRRTRRAGRQRRTAGRRSRCRPTCG